ncbi:hypothetical protein CJU89_6644 [Yarrowia sp. B02]|nr:hypothetical protein CJU89_6644 [Yarrowia sp. B02]
MTSRDISGFEEHNAQSRRKNLASQLRSYDLQSRITQLESKSRSLSTRFSLLVDASVLCSSNLPNVKAWLEERAATILVPKKTLEVLDQRKNGYLPVNMNARSAISYIEWVRANRADHPNPGKLIIQHNDESTNWKACQAHLVELPSAEELNLINNATMKETEMGSKGPQTTCPASVRPFIQCAIWRREKEESRDWWVVTEDPLTSLWCKAYGIRCLSPAEVEQEYRQRVRERRARAGEQAQVSQRGTNTEIPKPGEIQTATNATRTVPAATPTTPVPSAVAPPLTGNNIWSDSNSGWNDNMQSGFLQEQTFPPMPPAHMMNHNYSAYGQFQNFPVYPNMPGVDPFTGMGYSIGPWDPYDPYHNNYNYGNQPQMFSQPQPQSSMGTPAEEEPNDFSHFDSFDFLDEGDPADDIKSVEKQLKEVLKVADEPVTTPNKPVKPKKAHTAPPKTNSTNSNNGTPTKKSREPRSANRPQPKRTPGKKRNRPVDPDFVKRGEGVLWTP